jgi:hypothetical protein
MAQWSALFGGKAEGSRGDAHAERLMLDRAIGGWRGLIDSAVPTVVFLIVFVVSGNELTPALIAALVAGVGIALWRIVRREPLQQIATGFVGLAIAAGFAHFTDRAENFFLPGLLVNAAYGSALLISILVRWPLLGVAIGYLTGDGTAWRQDRQLRRLYTAATWLWVGLFAMRLVVQLPLYFAGALGPLGTVKIIMGWPLFLAAAYFTYRLLAPPLRERRERRSDAMTQES